MHSSYPLFPSCSLWQGKRGKAFLLYETAQYGTGTQRFAEDLHGKNEKVLVQLFTAWGIQNDEGKRPATPGMQAQSGNVRSADNLPQANRTCRGSESLNI